MISSNPSLDILNFRHHAKAAIRANFDRQGFIELDTPYLLMANTPDPFIDPIFVHGHHGTKKPFQLHTSPEIWLKRGISLGLAKIYHLARVFRDDPPGRHHSREFSMIEWYRVDAELSDLRKDCEDIFETTFKVAASLKLISIAKNDLFLELELDVLFRELANIDLPTVLLHIAQGKPFELQEVVMKKGDLLPRGATFSDAFFHVMLKYVEPNLPKSCIVVISRWPIQLAALAAPCADNPQYCARFEIYYGGLEIANAYQECNDPHLLRERIISENRERSSLGKPCFDIDEDFLRSVAHMPKTAGIALGIDRLFLAVLGKEKLADIIFGFCDH